MPILPITDPSRFLPLADGPLTAHALYESDSGVRCGLVMLSACQTGLGQVHSDSMIGLSSAFLVAGADSVGSTLWQIRDDVTVQLINRFYDSLLQERSLSSALKEAQLEVLRNPETRHPKFWAAFKITGKTSNPLSARLQADSPPKGPPQPSTGTLT